MKSLEECWYLSTELRGKVFHSTVHFTINVVGTLVFSILHQNSVENKGSEHFFTAF
jgi:hypothetical protein